MNNLVNAYESNDIKTFEKILKDNKKTILDDPFMRDYIDDLLKNIRTQVLIKLLAPYTKIRIPFISHELNIPPKEVEDLMVGLILDTKIRGRIDQVGQLLELETSKYVRRLIASPLSGYICTVLIYCLFLLTHRSNTYWKYRSVDRWASQLGTLQGTLLNKLP